MAAQTRSIRTMAWIGDATFELDVRRRLSDRGDYATCRLDAMKADLVCARHQAELLAEIEAQLDDEESAVVRRGRNASVGGGKARSKTDVRTHRSATGLEALVAYWFAEPDRRPRYALLLVPALEAAIDNAVARRAKKLRRG